MYDGSVFICSVHSEIRESTDIVTCANSKTMAWQRNFQQSQGKPKNDKRMLDKSVDGRDQKKTI